ncbi:MAG: hydrogen peroxide-inducible genes activator [Gemmatimonadaceae bacterium]
MADTLPSTGSMTLTQLAYVVAVDTHQHFGRAAEACNVTQPTLSMQLRKLERTLGVILFDRSHAPVVPTEVGRIIIAQARVALREAARVLDVRDAAAGIVAGELRLGVIPTLAPYLLPSVVPALARQYPQLELIIEERVTDDILEGLRRDTLDAGIVASPVAGPNMVERVLFSEPFVCYVSASHRLAKRKSITPADLSLDDLWLLSEGHCFRTETVRLCSERAAKGSRSEGSCTVGVRFESGNLETLKRLVERGAGMTLLPALAAADLGTAAQRRLLRPFTHPAPAREIRLVLRRAYHKQHLVKAVVDCVLASLPD